MSEKYFEANKTLKELREFIKKEADDEPCLCFGDPFYPENKILESGMRPRPVYLTEIATDNLALRIALINANVVLQGQGINIPQGHGRTYSNVFEIKSDWGEIPLPYLESNKDSDVWAGLGAKEEAVIQALACHTKPLLTDILLKRIQSKKKS